MSDTSTDFSDIDVRKYASELLGWWYEVPDHWWNDANQEQKEALVKRLNFVPGRYRVEHPDNRLTVMLIPEVEYFYNCGHSHKVGPPRCPTCQLPTVEGRYVLASSAEEV